MPAAGEWRCGALRALHPLATNGSGQRGRDALSGQHSALSVAKAGKGYARSRVCLWHRRVKRTAQCAVRSTGVPANVVRLCGVEKRGKAMPAAGCACGIDALRKRHSAAFFAKAGRSCAEARVVPRHGLPTFGREWGIFPQPSVRTISPAERISSTS